MDYQEAQIDAGLISTIYILGDKAVDGHDHMVYLRDDLPIATTTALDAAGTAHAHSIEKGPGDTVVCVPSIGHTHTKLVIENAGSYIARTLSI